MVNTHFLISAACHPALLAPAAAVMLLVSAPAAAQRFSTEGPPPDDPVIQLGEQLAPRNQFFINSDEDVEIIRFKQPKDVELCAGTAHASFDGPIKGYPIEVMWDNDTAIIEPGNCLAFDAQKARVRAASHLPQDIILTGTFRVIK